MADAEGLSIEETNKLRLSLGLKPLNVGAAPSRSLGDPSAPTTSIEQEKQAADNYRDHQTALERKRQADATTDRIRKARDKSERQRQLKGATLGDDDGEDTLAWIKRTREKAGETRTIAPKPKETREPQSYTTAELNGLRVGHELTEFESGDNVILTLKDGDVLDDDAQDELINVNLVDKEALETKLKNKKRKSVYTSYEDDELDPDTGEKRILAHYDDDIDAGPSKKGGFSIASVSGPVSTDLAPKSQLSNARKVFSLDSLARPTIAESDYAEPIKMRKSKKKKLTRRVRVEEDNLEDVAMENGPSTTSASAYATSADVNFVDDDDLQASLARQRRVAAHKRAVLKPEDIAAQIQPSDVQITAESGGGLTLDETTEFTRGLQDIKVPELKPARVQIAEPSPSGTQAGTPDIVMSEDSPGAVAVHEKKPVISNMGIEEEATFDQGIGAAMTLLRQKGVFKENEEEAALRRSKEIWLAKDMKMRMEIELERKRVREELRNSPRFKKMSVREREAFAASENRRLDALEAKATQERFKDYKPAVDIKYTDDFGRTMNQKEAFKHMSHQFHGKGSGSGKTAKKLAQIEKEKANEQKSLFSAR